jgi:hypothetical protein
VSLVLRKFIHAAIATAVAQWHVTLAFIIAVQALLIRRADAGATEAAWPRRYRP